MKIGIAVFEAYTQFMNLRTYCWRIRPVVGVDMAPRIHPKISLEEHKKA